MRKIAYFSFAGFLCFLIFSLTNKEAKNRFPQPSEIEIKEADRTVEQLAKDEVFTLSPSELAIFLWDIFKKGYATDFSYYNSNPQSLTVEQANKPATILLHGYGSNQGEWLPLLKWISEYNNETPLAMSGPIFTLEYPQASTKEDLIKKIEAIKKLYLKAGQDQVEINLVGHSLGGITSADYAYDPDSWVKGTHVQKVISIAGRLKNIEPPSQTPYYGYCYLLLPFIDELWHKIEENRGVTQLYTIAAAEDWLLPLDSVLVGDKESENTIVPNAGHALIGRKKETAQKVISWLFQNEANE